MIAIDTNVLVRFVTRDDESQARIASQLIRAAHQRVGDIFIPTVVLCEFVWVLRRAYKLPKRSVVEALHRILSTEGFTIESRGLTWRALAEFQRSSADFADCMIS